MKKMLSAAIFALLSTAVLSTGANAQTAAPAPAAKSATKPAVHPITHKPVKRVVRRKKSATVVAKTQPVPDGAQKWSCDNGESFYLKGDMKRDQIVTLSWDNRNYQLPREITTTGADRFHDLATGMDLVVIPFKAMLFQDTDSSRLADGCKNADMLNNGSPAPTQSNALIKTN